MSLNYWIWKIYDYSDCTITILLISKKGINKMKVTTIKYERKVTKEEKDSLGTYSNETLCLEGTIGENENVDIAICTLMERVHTHLDVKFDSPVKDKIASMLKDAYKKNTVLTDKDTTPSDPQLDRPKKVDDAKEELEKLEERKEDGKDDKPTKKQSGKAKKSTGKKEQPKVKEPVQEEEEKEEKVKEETHLNYDRSKVEHKKEIAAMLDEYLPDWRTVPSSNAKAKDISLALEGKKMFNPSGKIAASFTKLFKELLDA